MNDYELIAMNIQEKVDMGELTFEEANYLNDRAYEMYTEKLTDKFYKPIKKYKEIQKDCKELDEELKKSEEKRKKSEEEQEKIKKELEKKLKRKKIIKRAIIGSAAVGATAGLLYASNKDSKAAREAKQKQNINDIKIVNNNFKEKASKKNINNEIDKYNQCIDEFKNEVEKLEQILTKKVESIKNNNNLTKEEVAKLIEEEESNFRIERSKLMYSYMKKM